MSALKDYCSGTSSSDYRSHRGSSFESSSNNIKLGQFTEEGSIKEIKEMLNYDEYLIESRHLPALTASNCPEIMAQTVNSEVSSSDEENLAKSEMFSKQSRHKRIASREG
jgi:hypothetical protein